MKKSVIVIIFFILAILSGVASVVLTILNFMGTISLSNGWRTFFLFIAVATIVYPIKKFFWEDVTNPKLGKLKDD